MRLGLAFVLAGCGAPHPSAPPRETVAAVDAGVDAHAANDEVRAQREHCEAYDRDRKACEADPRCMTMFRPGRSGPYSFGGPTVCVACVDAMVIRGTSTEVCRLRTEGRVVEACRLMFPDRPERCEPRAADAGVTPSP